MMSVSSSSFPVPVSCPSSKASIVAGDGGLQFSSSAQDAHAPPSYSSFGSFGITSPVDVSSFEFLSSSNWQLAFCSIFDRHPDVCLRWLQSLGPFSSNPTIQQALSQTKDNRGFTLLHFAAAFGANLLVATILDIIGSSKSNLHVRDAYGRTALMHAVFGNHLDTCALLVKKGASINSQDFDGRTPLHSAVETGNDSMVEGLLNLGADPRIPNIAGEPPLHVAASMGHLGCLRLLVKSGAPINSRDLEGDTALHFAVRNEFPAVVQLLLENRADPQAKNDEGRTPQDLALEYQIENLYQMLGILPAAKKGGFQDTNSN